MTIGDREAMMLPDSSTPRTTAATHSLKRQSSSRASSGTRTPRRTVATRSLKRQSSSRASGERDTPITEIYRLRSCMQVVTLKDSLSSPCTPSRKTSASLRKRVRWNTVEIREYERSVGDHPSCSDGPPVGIGWKYVSTQDVLSIDDYENTRPPRRDEFELVLTREAREDILVTQCGATQTEIAQAVRENRKYKFQRRRTINNLDTWDRIEEGVEKARRKVKRAFSLRQSSFKKLQSLQEESERANSVLAAMSLLDDQK